MTDWYWGARALYGQVYSCTSFATAAERDQWVADAPVSGSRLALPADDARVLAFLNSVRAMLASLDEVSS